jgi:dihydroflavonol-4-reductase
VIFVTGGTGLLGNCIVRELAARGEPVRALCRSGTSRDPFNGLDVDIVEGDLSCADALAGFMEGCRAVIHSAALIHIGWSRLQQSREVNVEGTRRVVQACLTQGVKLVHVSTVDTLPAAQSIDQPVDETSASGVAKVRCSYVISKTEADAVVRAAISDSSLKATLVHPGFMLGPYDWKPSSGRMLLAVAKAPLAIAPEGGCSLCDARDVAAATVAAVEQGGVGQSYILAGHNLTYRELWRMIRTNAGRSHQVVCPKRVLNAAGWALSGWQRLFPDWEGDVNPASIAMGRLGHYYSSFKAQRELQYLNRRASETLDDAWQWLKERFR